MWRCVLGLLMVVALARPAQAQPAARCFPEAAPAIAECVAGDLVAFWERAGGLAIFGYPLSAAGFMSGTPSSRPAQLFERNRLEMHAGNAAPYQFLLGRLGAERLQAQGRDWRTEGTGESMGAPCRSYETTGRSICGPFLRYWQSHGLEFGDRGISERESLALFGLPLTAPKMETNAAGDRRLTQWFERTRMEYWPTNAEPYTVQLGLLGTETGIAGSGIVSTAPRVTSGDCEPGAPLPINGAQAWATRSPFATSPDQRLLCFRLVLNNRPVIGAEGFIMATSGERSRRYPARGGLVTGYDGVASADWQTGDWTRGQVVRFSVVIMAEGRSYTTTIQAVP